MDSVNLLFRYYPQKKNNHLIIPQLWDQFFSRENEIKNKAGSPFFGICKPQEDKLKTHPDECLYISCASVLDFSFVPDGMITETIAACEYAVFTHKGKLDQLDHTMNYIYGSWLPKSGYKLKEAPDLEIYDHRFNPISEDSEFDIYIPIIKPFSK